MIRRHVVGLTLSVALAGLFAGGCSGSNKPAAGRPGAAAPAPTGASKAAKRLVFITNGDDPFWDALLSGLKEGEKRFGCAAAGLTVSRDVNNASAEGQIERLRQYATQDDIAGIAISVIQADNQSIIEEMRKLQAKGVKVITVDGDVNRDTFRDARPFIRLRALSLSVKPANCT